MEHPKPIKNYLASRGPVLYYLGGLGAGAFLGRQYVWIGFSVALILLWIQRAKKKE